MKKILFLISILLIVGCTQEDTSSSQNQDVILESSSINITSADPVEGTIIDDTTRIYLDIEYEIGNFNSSERYFIGITIIVNDTVGAAVAGIDEEVTNKSGVINNFFVDTDFINIYSGGSRSYLPPYNFRVSLNKRLLGYSFARLANTTITYQGELE